MKLIYEVQKDEINSELNRKYRELEALVNRTDIKPKGELIEVPLSFLIEKSAIERQIDILLQMRLYGMHHL